MTRSTRILTLLAGASFAAGTFAGAAGALTPPAPGPIGPDIEANPCVVNPDLPQCQDDDDGPIIPDLEFHPCTWFPEMCPDDGGEDPGGDPGKVPGEEPGEDPGEEPAPESTDDPVEDTDIPAAEPADAVTASPNFTG